MDEREVGVEFLERKPMAAQMTVMTRRRREGALHADRMIEQRRTGSAIISPQSEAVMSLESASNDAARPATVAPTNSAADASIAESFVGSSKRRAMSANTASITPQQMMATRMPRMADLKNNDFIIFSFLSVTICFVHNMLRKSKI